MVIQQAVIRLQGGVMTRSMRCVFDTWRTSTQANSLLHPQCSRPDGLDLAAVPVLIWTLQ